MIKAGFVTLGCPKNQVDSEHMQGMLEKEKDMKEVNDFNKADVLIINTCGFINDAKEESIETILEAARYKEAGQCQALIVTGCLSQRYGKELMEEIPEIDAILGTGTFDNIVSTIRETITGNKIKNIGRPALTYKSTMPRKLKKKAYAYVKIAEGCNNNCSYCTIPLIRGPLQSREISDIYREVQSLVAEGYKEIILIAQDTTQYGTNLYGKPSLKELLEELLQIKGYFWLRIMYSYPEHITKNLISLIGSHSRICNYLDLPLQHSENRIRRQMNREGTKQSLIKSINFIRRKIPDIHLRTSIIVGFPGETDSDFNSLKKFVKNMQFERLGVFQYSREEDTAAADFPNQISEEIKTKRYQELMEIQQQISLQQNQKLVGKKLEVIIDKIEEEYSWGRSQYDAPEIDNQVHIDSGKGEVNVGSLIQCRITDGFEYDILGERVDEFTK